MDHLAVQQHLHPGQVLVPCGDLDLAGIVDDLAVGQVRHGDPWDVLVEDDGDQAQQHIAVGVHELDQQRVAVGHGDLGGEVAEVGLLPRAADVEPFDDGRVVQPQPVAPAVIGGGAGHGHLLGVRVEGAAHQQGFVDLQGGRRDIEVEADPAVIAERALRVLDDHAEVVLAGGDRQLHGEAAVLRDLGRDRLRVGVLPVLAHAAARGQGDRAPGRVVTAQGEDAAVGARVRGVRGNEAGRLLEHAVGVGDLGQRPGRPGGPPGDRDRLRARVHAVRGGEGDHCRARARSHRDLEAAILSDRSRGLTRGDAELGTLALIDDRAGHRQGAVLTDHRVALRVGLHRGDGELGSERVIGDRDALLLQHGPVGAEAFDEELLRTLDQREGVTEAPLGSLHRLIADAHCDDVGGDIAAQQQRPILHQQRLRAQNVLLELRGVRDQHRRGLEDLRPDAQVEARIEHRDGDEGDLLRVDLDRVAAIRRLGHRDVLAGGAGHGGRGEDAGAVLEDREGEQSGLIGTELHLGRGGVDPEGEVGALPLLLRTEPGLDPIGVLPVRQRGIAHRLRVVERAVESGTGPLELAGIGDQSPVAEQVAIDPLLLAQHLHLCSRGVQHGVADVRRVAHRHQVRGDGVHVAVAVGREPELPDVADQREGGAAPGRDQLALHAEALELLTHREHDRLGIPVTGEAEEGHGEVRLGRVGRGEPHPAAGEVICTALGGDGDLDGCGALGRDGHRARRRHGPGGGAHRGGAAGVIGLGQQGGAREGELRGGVPAIGERHGEGGRSGDLAQRGGALTVDGGDDLGVQRPIDLGKTGTDLTRGGRRDVGALLDGDHGRVHQHDLREIHPFGAGHVGTGPLEMLEHQRSHPGDVRGSHRGAGVHAVVAVVDRGVHVPADTGDLGLEVERRGRSP